MAGESVGHYVGSAVVFPAVDDALAFLVREAVHLREQGAVGSAGIYEEVNEDGAAGGEFAGGEGFDAVVADQIEQLESFVEAHGVSIICRGVPALTLGAASGAERARGGGGWRAMRDVGRWRAREDLTGPTDKFLARRGRLGGAG